MNATVILEEIALEGLDGITLNALWLRLTNRPGLYLEAIDDCVKQYVWKIVCQSRDIDFFLLQDPRPELVLIDFDSHIQDYKCYISCQGALPADVYSFKIIDKKGVLGCCDTVDSRVPIRNQICSDDGVTLLSVQEATEKWGQKLTIVASQKLRFRATLQTNYLPSGITPETYAVVERVGRARFVGEPTKIHGRPGLTNDAMTATNLFCVIKNMCKRGYMTKQPFNMIIESPRKQLHSRLIHLRQFYRKTNANTNALLKAVCAYLKSVPDMRLPIEAVTEKVGFKWKGISKHVGLSGAPISVESVPYRSVYPNSSKEEYSGKNGQERHVKILRLDAPYRIEEGNDDDDKDEEEQDEFDTSTDVGGLVSDRASTGQYLYDKSIPSTIRIMIAQAGTKGLTEVQIRRKLHCVPRVVDQTLRGLVNCGAVVPTNYTSGTVRTKLFMSPEAHVKLNEMKAEKEEHKVEADMNETQESRSAAEESALEGVATEAEGESGKAKGDSKSMDETLLEMKPRWVIEKVETPKAPDEIMSEKRKLRRDFILKKLASKKVLAGTSGLFNEMLAWEKARGWKEIMCRKSMKRIIKELYHEGKLNHFELTFDSSPNGKPFLFLADANVKEDDMALKEAAFNHYMFNVKYQEIKLKKAEEENELVPAPKTIRDMLQIAAQDSKVTTPTVSKEISPKPGDSSHFAKHLKMEKVQMLHEYMFYLIYDYKGNPNAAENVSADEAKKGPPVFLDVDDWRRYVPPIKIHNVAKMTKMIPGACMMGDLLMSMPIHVFQKVIFITWEVTGLQEILDDSDKKLYPLHHLPIEVLNDLLKARNYLQKLNDTVRRLCHMGLLSYGPKASSQHLEFVILYLHKKAMMLDTSISLEGRRMTTCPTGREFVKMRYVFDSLDKIRLYWSEVYLICISSNLGHKSIKDKPGNQGEINLLKASKPQEFSNIREDDWLPGDQRGAGGFDSSLFLHLLRGWCARVVRIKEVESAEAAIRRKRKLPAKVPPNQGPKKKEKSAAVIAKEPPKKRMKKDTKKLKVKRRQSQAREGAAKKYPRAPKVLDDDDKLAKKQMERMRSRFSPLENGAILICHVACLVLNPHRPPADIPFKAVRRCVRDLMPDIFKDKTHYAIRARSHRLRKDENFLQHIIVYLAKASYDRGLMEKYENIGVNFSDPDVVAKYTQLVKDLFQKFRSRDKTLAMPWPSTLEKFHKTYDVAVFPDILHQKLHTANVNCDVLMDIQTYLLRDVLVGWMYNPSLVSNTEMYFNFCKYPKELITKTCDILKLGGVVTHCKKPYDVGIQRHGLIHNITLTQRHREAMKSFIPVEVYENVVGQIEALEEAFQATHRATPATVSGDGTEGREPPGASSVPRPWNSSEACQGGSVSVPVHEDGRQVASAFRELNLKQFQGGCPMALISLFTLDMVDVKIFIPDDMIQLTESALKQLSFKKPDGGKRTADEMEETANESNEDDLRPPLKSMRKKLILKGRSSKAHGGPAESTAASSSSSPSKTKGDGNERSGTSTLKCVKNSNFMISFNHHQGKAIDSLSSYAVYIASGTLLTLARTSMMESLDVVRSNYHCKGNFVIEPLKIQLALKKDSGAVGTDGETKKSRLSDDCTSEQGRKSLMKSQTETETEPNVHCVSSEEMTASVEQATNTNVITSTFSNKPVDANGQTQKTSFSRFEEDRFVKTISHLEQSFPVDFDKTDVMEELRTSLPQELRENGQNVYQLIDSYGFPGITEPELEGQGKEKELSLV